MIPATAVLLLLPAFAYLRMQDQATPTDGEAGQGDAPDTLPEQSFLETIGLMMGKLTRGERNNNPGNIRLSSASWQGKTQGADAAFETFISPEYGIRALAVLLRTYQTKYGLRTVRQIINRWAPPSENNTLAYIRAVATEMGVTPDQVIDLNNPDTLGTLCAAIIHHENGRVIYSVAQIDSAISIS